MACWKCPCSYSFWQSEKYIFAYVPQKTGTFFSVVAAEVRKCSPSPQPWPGIFRSTPTGLVGGRFFTNFCEGFVFPREEIARGCVSQQLLRNPLGMLRAGIAGKTFPGAQPVALQRRLYVLHERVHNPRTFL